MSDQTVEQGEVRDEELDPEREARRRLALAQIRQYPDPVLRMRSNEVESFDDDLRRLVERMTELMRDANGVGLAGTQVGTLQRVFVFQPDGEDQAPRALVNPVLAATSEVTLSDTEGCLSMQGVSIPVERPVKVTIEGKDENGDDVRLELEERVLLHVHRHAHHREETALCGIEAGGDEALSDSPARPRSWAAIRRTVLIPVGPW